jgi:hypothetical protein
MLKRLLTHQFLPALIAAAALLFATTAYTAHVDKDAHGKGKTHCEICLVVGSTPAAPASPAIMLTPTSVLTVLADLPNTSAPAARRFSAHRSRAPPSLS